MDWSKILKGIWRFWGPVLIIAASIIAVVALSFLLWGPFSFPAFSDRLFWCGIGAVIVGGFAIWAALGSYSTLGTPSVLTAPGDAPIAHERIREHIRMNAGRYRFTFRAFSIGAICLVVAILAELLSR
jgi:hypothetical protein